MNTSEQEQDRWESCPPGTLARTVHGIRARQRDRRRAKIVGLTGGAAVLLLAAAIISQQSGLAPVESPNLGKITCAKVKSLLPAFIAGRLEAAVTGQVESHLDACPHCRERYEKTKDETAFPGHQMSDSSQLAMRT
ncbi:MAG: zf-HC2 domain-containing protein [Pirellulaceae bacterium]|nr:zf-HC2 domain-containing protein [Pirellulaceae bacterium]MDP6718355.1 zf-HC2 domain-containing protein [Pirellulaceae bacterium]